jgi:hypothetical protein
VPTKHSLVSADPIGVVGRTSKHFAPPGGHVPSVLLVHTSRKKWREQLVLLDSVIEGVDQAIKSVSPASPFVQRRVVSHEQNVIGVASVPFGSSRRLGANCREGWDWASSSSFRWLLGTIEPDRKYGDACLGPMASVAWRRLGGVVQMGNVDAARHSHEACGLGDIWPSAVVVTSQIQEVIDAGPQRTLIACVPAWSQTRRA